ncbi:hypothetical protein [Xenorhabdus kozodoii]|uniref:Transposase n=1 Tax=Xenorhabdus kozodoii TaxID=351676 RepID=A0A2D0L807_9GAMM|nr:hypothetical protein [Xenorhabdus kozodoii]PHM71831.1 hypothetical protein Xkoz_02560 [Xenorhabdus kozodoii]
MRRNRYTPEQKQRHVTQWRHSDLTRKQYCECNRPVISPRFIR